MSRSAGWSGYVIRGTAATGAGPGFRANPLVGI